MTHPDDHLAAIRAELSAAGVAHERALTDMTRVVGQLRAEIRAETSHVEQLLRGEGARFARSLGTHLREHTTETARRLTALGHRLVAVASIYLAAVITIVILIRLS